MTLIDQWAAQHSPAQCFLPPSGWRPPRRRKRSGALVAPSAIYAAVESPPLSAAAFSIHPPAGAGFGGLSWCGVPGTFFFWPTCNPQFPKPRADCEPLPEPLPFLIFSPSPATALFLLTLPSTTSSASHPPPQASPSSPAVKRIQASSHNTNSAHLQRRFRARRHRKKKTHNPQPHPQATASNPPLNIMPRQSKKDDKKVAPAPAMMPSATQGVIPQPPIPVTHRVIDNESFLRVRDSVSFTLVSLVTSLEP